MVYLWTQLSPLNGSSIRFAQLSVYFQRTFDGKQSLLFVLTFTNSFLNLKTLHPRTHILFNWFSRFALLFTLICPFVSYGIMIRPVAFAAALTSPFVLFIGWRSWRAGYVPARYFTLAWGCLLLGIMALALKNLGVLPAVFITEYSFQIGGAMEVVLLSLHWATECEVQGARCGDHARQLPGPGRGSYAST